MISSCFIEQRFQIESFYIHINALSLKGNKKVCIVKTAVPYTFTKVLPVIKLRGMLLDGYL